MKIRILIFGFFLFSSCQNLVFSQQYSFSVFAFRIYDGNNLILKLNEIDGFNKHSSIKKAIDSLSKFKIKAVYFNEDIVYQSFAKHKDGIWLLYAENFKKHRPIRFFSIIRELPDGKEITMRIFLNYYYHSCEMPCVFGQANFKISDIQFREGNFMFLDRLNFDDWQIKNPNLVEIDEDIFYYLFKNKIELWDLKMKN